MMGTRFDRAYVTYLLQDPRHAPRWFLGVPMRVWRAWENRFHPSQAHLDEISRLADIGTALGIQNGEKLAVQCERELEILSAQLSDEIRRRSILPFPLRYALEEKGLRALYFLCRCLTPRILLETGVANGVSSRYILEALSRNQTGLLISIDYPELDIERRQGTGCLVPRSLLGQWKLILGDSKRVMKRLLLDGTTVDLFLHDSDHAYLNMRTEFSLAWTALRPGGVFLSDDIEENSAFEEFILRLPQGVALARCGRMGILRRPFR